MTACSRQKIAAQRELIPSMYGEVDFSAMPERYTDDPADESSLGGKLGRRRRALLANKERVAIIRAYTMLGDSVADAYAALVPQYGFRRLVALLDRACRHGIEHVPDAPAELVAFVRAMEDLPDWVDMTLVEEGARRERNVTAHATPFVVRGAFFATFMNKYSALPMALTGTLSNETAARRVKETAAFFTTSVMPGALQRYGEGFRAAAMVRLMHSLVRYNALTGDRGWDTRTYGIPIPQVDQMPAGMINIFILARRVLHEGRTTFTRAERSIVELARYRCFLLGLPEELLAETPRDIVDMLLTRACTLRKGFDDATCGALVRATMAADLSQDSSLAGRLQARMERSFARLFFLRNFANNDRAESARVGIDLEPADYAWAAVTAVWIATHMASYELAARIPVVREIADKNLVRKLSKLLGSYGHPEYSINAETRGPAQAVTAAIGV